MIIGYSIILFQLYAHVLRDYVSPFKNKFVCFLHCISNVFRIELGFEKHFLVCSENHAIYNLFQYTL